MGPEPTLPPNHQSPPATRHVRSRRPDPHVDGDLVLDAERTPTTHPEQDRPGYAEHQQEAAVRLHRQLTDLDASARRAERPAEEPEPLGRRLPVPLAGHEGVER